MHNEADDYKMIDRAAGVAFSRLQPPVVPPWVNRQGQPTDKGEPETFNGLSEEGWNHADYPGHVQRRPAYPLRREVMTMSDEVLVTGEEAARLVWKTTLDDMIKTEPIIDEATIRTQLRIQPFNLNDRWDRNMVFGAVFVAGYLQGVRRERIRQRLRRQKKELAPVGAEVSPKQK